jgi:hypothetical protein
MEVQETVITIWYVHVLLLLCLPKRDQGKLVVMEESGPRGRWLVTYMDSFSLLLLHELHGQEQRHGQGRV